MKKYFYLLILVLLFVNCSENNNHIQMKPKGIYEEYEIIKVGSDTIYYFPNDTMIGKEYILESK
ncbi:hypothetical protein [Aureivirga sp. CE67]|uniref:hypothetical protein n=1 Tax=Aureivirga sp. CE67 TaxID=1788983 RepID=UPI0018C93175|nr:hypothetical protein [Aureivirga sp. CE67]